jgi:serine/threonine-protein kinase
MSRGVKRIGRYEIVERVGQGGMGVLYRARDPVLDREVAIKTMLVDFAAESGARERFEREAKAIAKLQHHNIVTIHELGEVDGAPYIVMEFLAGHDLDARLGLEPSLSLAQKLDIATQLLAGLAYAHGRGIVHRDIKPSNVRVLPDGTVKIVDFGIAKFARSGSSHPGQAVGSPAYMAPEQLRGDVVDGRADLFSVGVLLYELLAGRRPFIGESPTTFIYGILNEHPTPLVEAVPGVPRQLGEIVARALEKDADRRYASANEMADELQIARLELTQRLPAEPAVVVQPGAATASAAPAAKPASAGPADYVRRLVVMLSTPRGALAAVGVVAIVIAAVGLMWFAMPSRQAAAPGAVPGASQPAPKPEAAVVPAPPPPAEVWSLEVITTPPGARVVLDGAETKEVTPAKISGEGPRPRQLRLVRDGYQARDVKLTDEDYRAGRREETLVSTSATGVVVLEGEYPFEVVLGTRVLSAMATSHQVSVPVLATAVTLRSPDYFLDHAIRVAPQPGRRVEVVAPRLGSLAVFAANETCAVLIDGHEAGYPPIANQMVAAVSHRVTLKCPDGVTPQQTVSVAAGQRATVTFKTIGK